MKKFAAITRSSLAILFSIVVLTACQHAGPTVPPAALPKAAVVPVKPAVPAPPQILVVGAWNMEWLGNTERRPDQPEPQAIAQYIRNSHVSALGMEEICETEPHTRKNTLLEKTVQLLSTNGVTWNYQMFNSKAARGQNCGVMWNATVLTATAPFEIPVDRGHSSQNLPKWDRAPYAVQFSAGPGKTDFVLIPVHMKSNISGSGGAKTPVHRQEEAKALMDSLVNVGQHYRGARDQEKDILILGDFNTLHRTEPAITTYESAGFIDLNPQDLPTQKSPRYAPAPFDRVLTPAGQPEFARHTFTIVTNGYSASLSDHHMVTTEITVMPDDD